MVFRYFAVYVLANNNTWVVPYCNFQDTFSELIHHIADEEVKMTLQALMV